MTSESVVEWEGCSFRFDKRQSLFFIPLSCSLPRYLCKLWACYLQSKFGHEIIRLGTVGGIPETICLICYCIVPSSASNASAIESDCRKLFINCPHKWLWNSHSKSSGLKYEITSGACYCGVVTHHSEDSSPHHSFISLFHPHTHNTFTQWLHNTVVIIISRINLHILRSQRQLRQRGASDSVRGSTKAKVQWKGGKFTYKWQQFAVS